MKGFFLDGATLRVMAVLFLGLATSSLLVGLLGRASSTGTLRLQVNSWWWIFPLFSLAWVAYPLGPWLLVGLIAALAARELALHHPTAPRRFIRACIALVVLQVVMIGAAVPGLLWLVPALALLQSVLLWRQPKPERLLWLLFLFLCGGLAFVPGLENLPMAQSNGGGWFFYLFVVTALNDVAQFICGKSLGQRKIAKSISPQKTWAGFLGGMLFTPIVSLALGLHLQLAPAQFLLALGLVLSVGGFFGDLLFSAAKRALHLKDFSNLIPGHGGILDRVDSLVLTAPLLYLALRWFLP